MTYLVPLIVILIVTLLANFYILLYGSNKVSLESCAHSCNQNLQCKSFTLINGACSLKKYDLIASFKTPSGLIYKTSNIIPGVRLDYHFKVIYTDNDNYCSKICGDTLGCVASIISNGNCLLYDSTQNYHSGLLNPYITYSISDLLKVQMKNTPSSSEIIYQYNIYGEHLCWEACLKDTKCVYFTGDGGNKCYLYDETRNVMNWNIIRNGLC